jgi:hypothetical protein
MPHYLGSCLISQSLPAKVTSAPLSHDCKKAGFVTYAWLFFRSKISVCSSPRRKEVMNNELGDR